ncbi:MAG: hypothetical protein ACI9FB_000578 [Candidatus Azotimanducaceae bacterium]|jgi:hypothetical protein
MEDLHTGYYLDNFNFLLNFVAKQYADILTPEEQKYRQVFQSNSKDAQRLYVRLYGRKGPYFRLDKISYEEIENLNNAVRELLSNGFLSSPTSPDPISLLALMTKKELVETFGDSDKAAYRKMRRGEIEDILLQKYTASEFMGSIPFKVIEPLGNELITLYRLLFFGNLHQDFTEFVLRDIGLTPFEDYSLDYSGRYFEKRELLDKTLMSYELESSCFDALEEGDLDSLKVFSSDYLIQPYLDTITEVSIGSQKASRLNTRINGIYNRVAREFERYNCEKLALELYEKNTFPPSLERQARIHAKSNSIEAALIICKKLYHESKNEAEVEFAHSFARRLMKKHKILDDWLPAKISESFQTEMLVLDEGLNEKRMQGLGVEKLVVAYFEGEGHEACYVENSLIPGLFGLYFWDIIFAPVKGVFFNPFQRGPIDLFTPEFCSLRINAIQQHLDLMLLGIPFRETVRENYEKKYGIANYFVNWSLIDFKLLELSIERIPVADLHLMFKRLLNDLRRNCSGFPDLIVFPSEGGFHFSEVKGPGDKLQESQRRWFRYFDKHNIPSEIVHVSWS